MEIKQPQKKQAVFNGHTWIVVIVSIILLFILGAGAMSGLFYMTLKLPETDTFKLLQAVGIAYIPKIVVEGIIKIVDRLTYLPKEG